uniref:RING-type E3 ubiquitin transferase n=1 Tax=Aegilops tauschii TaxID=37682 RepID=R7W1G8_AEGTA
MAAEGDEEGAAAPKVVGLALSGSKSSAHVLRWALGNFAHDDAPPAAFKLIHVLTPVLAVPTPMGHLLPIDEVSTSVAEGELEKMWIEKQEMLQRCKDACDENKLEVLSKIRHPHLLMLLGACPDRGCLVYEYMENGSLADRLQRRKGTPPIPWFDRFRIAWEIGSALVFLHSTKPSPIIHRDLKPENVLLDRNLVSKIGDVGLSTLMPPKETLSNRTVYKKTGLAGTLFYLDPEYQRTGQVSVKSDTYALGMVILELLTARCPIGLPEVVERAVEDGQISDVLDESAGDWPVREAHDLAQLGLNCLEMRSKDRPDLNSVVLEELGRLKRIAASVSGVALPGSPSHFKCPILKTVMYDPCIASDGYTYERSAMEMWLCDKDVSPVTKARLRDKTLLPNLSLKSAIMRGCSFRCRSIVSTLEYCLPLFGSYDNLLPAVKSGSILSSDLERVVKPNAAFLRECGLGACDIARLCIPRPSLLSISMDRIRTAVACVEGLGVPRGSRMFKHALQAVAFLSKDKITANVEHLKKMFRWSDAEETK